MVSHRRVSLACLLVSFSAAVIASDAQAQAHGAPREPEGHSNVDVAYYYAPHSDRYCTYDGTTNYCGDLTYTPSCCGSTCCPLGYYFCDANNDCVYENPYQYRYCPSNSSSSSGGSYCGYYDYQPNCCGDTCCGEGYDYCSALGDCLASDENYGVVEDRYCESTLCGSYDYQPKCCGSTCCASGYNYCDDMHDTCSQTEVVYSYYYCESNVCGYMTSQPNCCGSTCCWNGEAYCDEDDECSSSPTPTASPTGMSSAEIRQVRLNIGQAAADNALTSTIRKSGLYVGNAIRTAGVDFPVTYGTGTAAGEFGALLLASGFSHISKNEQRKNGDVAVWSIVTMHKHGHVQIFHENKWYSDYEQSSLSPWYLNFGSKVKFYRYMA
jgi:hypothetical protein